MKDQYKNKKQLIEELETLHKEVDKLKKAETKRKLKKEGFREVGKKYRNILDFCPIGIGIADLNGKIVTANKGMQAITGYSVKELKKVKIIDIYEKKEERDGLLKAISRYGAVSDYPVRLKRKDGTPYDALLNVSRINLGGKIFLHTMCQDITERKRAEEALREGEEKFRAIADYTADWENWVAPDGSLIWVNPAVERITGYSVEEFLAKHTLSLPLCAEEDQAVVKAQFERAMLGSRENDQEFRFVRKDGTKRWGSVSWQPIFSSDGKPLGHRSSIRDITERKRAEEKLQESEKLLGTFMNAIQESAFVVDTEGVVVIANETLAQRIGTNLNELIGTCIYNHLPPEIARERKTQVEEVIRTGKPLRYEDRRAGVWIDSFVYPILGEEGKVMNVGVLAVDITERKRAEEALRETQELLTSILDNAPMLIYVTSHDNRYRLVNKAWETFVRLPREEAVGRLIEQVFSPKTACQFMEANQQVIDMGIPVVTEEFVDRSDGLYYFHTVKFPLSDTTGKVTSIGGVSFDITERKQAEEALIKSELRFRNCFDLPLIGFAITSPEKGWIEVNDRICSILGYSRDEIVRKSWSELTHPDDLAADIEQFNLVLSGQIEKYSMNKRFIRKDGEIVWTSISVGCVREPDGRVDYIIGLMEDITERKQVEEALRRKSGEQDLLLDNIQTQIWYLTDKETYGAVNKARAEFFGKKNEEMENKKVCDVLTKDEAEICMSGYVEVFEKRKQIHTEEWITNAKGEKRLLSIIKSPKLDENGDIEYVVCSAEDITERKRVEEKLKKSESLLKEAQHVASIGHWELDAAIGTPTWSEEIFHIFDLDPVQGEPSFKAHENIVHFDDWHILNNAVTKASTEGIPFDIEFRLLRPDKSIRWMNAKGYATRNSEGRIVRLFGTAQDITERKRAEKERDQLFEQVHASRERLRNLSRRLVEVQEVERRELVRKLHDEVGQSLTALSINLNIVHSQLPPETATQTVTRIDDSLKLVEETVERIRDVMAELRPPVLDDYGVSAALHWYGKQFSERTGIPAVLKVEELKPRLPLPEETALFRIAQEALTNVAKYAQAKNVTVGLEEFDKVIHLTIADDGVGFDPTAHHQQGARPEWGLINMRERAQTIGGTLNVETAPGKGTKIVVEIKRK